MDKHKIHLSSSQVVPILNVLRNVQSKPKNLFIKEATVKENQRRRLENIGKILGVKDMSDWGKITTNQVRSRDSKVQWKDEWFVNGQVERGRWDKSENVRNFLEGVAKQLGIKKANDWGKVSISQFITLNGGTLLRKFHGSLLRLLKFTYPEIQWNSSWFNKHPKLFWTNQQQRKYFEALAKRKQITKPSDWGKVTLQEIVENNGAGILRLHNGSLFKALNAWKREWFPNLSRYPVYFWENVDNRKSFMEGIAHQYGIHKLTDWSRVTSSLILKHGGRGLLAKYNNSLLQLLSSIYPHHNWTPKYESYNEQHVEEFVMKFFPLEEILRNYRHPKLQNPNSFMSIELDIWVPRYNLAFECHGTHHYRNTYNINLGEQQFRDSLRRKKCEEERITLIEVPYWWDKKEASLLSTLLRARPDLVSQIQSKLIEKKTLVKSIAT